MINCQNFIESKVKYLVERLKIIKESKVSMFDTQNRDDFHKLGRSQSRDIKSLGKIYLVDDNNINRLKKNVFNINLSLFSKPGITDNIKSDDELIRKPFDKASSSSIINDKINGKKKLISKMTNRKGLILSLIPKNSLNALSIKEETMSNADVQNSLNNLGSNEEENTQILKKMIISESSKDFFMKRKSSEIITKQGFEQHQIDDTQKKDFPSFTLQNYFKNHVKIESRKDLLTSRSDIHIIDMLNIIDNGQRNKDRNNKSAQSISSLLFEKDKKNLRIEKMLAPINIMRKKKNESKSIRYKHSSTMKIEEKLLNQMKIINTNIKFKSTENKKN